MGTFQNYTLPKRRMYSPGLQQEQGLVNNNSESLGLQRKNSG